MTKKSEIIKAIGPMHQSGLSAFKACPLKFKYLYIDKIQPEVQHSAAVFGTSVHACLSKMLTVSLDIDLEKEFLKALDDAVKETKVRIFWKESREKYLKNALEILTEFREYWKENPAKVLYSEVKFRCTIMGIKYEGIIDLVTEQNGEEILWDFKTNKQRPKDVFLKQSTQLNLYAWALLKGELFVEGKWIKPKINISQMGWFFLRSLERYKRKVPGHEIGGLKGDPKMLVQHSKEDFKIFKKDLKNLLHSVLTTHWYPNENGCSVCSFSDLCMNRSEVINQPELTEQQKELIAAFA